MLKQIVKICYWDFETGNGESSCHIPELRSDFCRNVALKKSTNSVKHRKNGKILFQIFAAKFFGKEFDCMVTDFFLNYSG